jgi:hypothetical protein
MDIKEQLQFLISYYDMNRGVGHTATMVDGIVNKKPQKIKTITGIKTIGNPKVLVHSAMGGECIKKNFSLPKSIQYVSINSLDSLRGASNPLVIDNCAAYVLFLNSLNKIKELEEKNTQLTNRIEKIKEIL